MNSFDVRGAAAGRPPDEAGQKALTELQRALAQAATPSRVAEAAASANERQSESLATRGQDSETAARQDAGVLEWSLSGAPGAGDRSGSEQGSWGRQPGLRSFPDLTEAYAPARPLALGSVVGSTSFGLQNLASPGLPAQPVQDPGGGPPPSLPQQVVRAVHLQWRQGLGEARLQLHPEHLGQLTVTLRVVGGVVSAHLRAESRLALERIEGSQHELRTALEQLGLRLDELVVGIDPDARGRRQQPETAWTGPRSNRSAKGQPSFDLDDLTSG